VPARLGGASSEPPDKREYKRANETPQTSAGQPFDRDPNEIDRALAAHAKTQNALRDFLVARGAKVWSRLPGEPDFDLAWDRRGTVWVGEVKSLNSTNESQQLRLGLGQVLDYQDLMLVGYAKVRAALIVSSPPKERRWVDVCERHGVTLVWPGTFDAVLR
jgi:hypothetical protein